MPPPLPLPLPSAPPLQVAASLKGVAQVGAVNCDDHRKLCQQEGVKGYPTIKAFVPGGPKGGKLFKGDRRDLL